MEVTLLGGPWSSWGRKSRDDIWELHAHSRNIKFHDRDDEGSGGALRADVSIVHFPVSQQVA